jgi:large subunit ribosomal protein L21
MTDNQRYAVIRAGGSQYLVREGDEIEVMRLGKPEGEKLVFDQVLLVKDGDEVKVGGPTVEGAKVEAKVEKHLRGDKIRVATYKAKSRYRRVKGHRDELTKVKIEKIYVKN